MTKQNKTRALESESDPALASVMTLSTVFNSSVDSSIKWEWRLLQQGAQTKCSRDFGGSVVICHSFLLAVVPAHAYILPICNQTQKFPFYFFHMLIILSLLMSCISLGHLRVLVSSSVKWIASIHIKYKTALFNLNFR